MLDGRLKDAAADATLVPLYETVISHLLALCQNIPPEQVPIELLQREPFGSGNFKMNYWVTHFFS